MDRVESFLRKRGMLKEGFNQFIIRGEFGEVSLNDLLTDFLKEQVDVVDKTMSLPAIQARLPEGLSESDALEFKKKWIEAMRDTSGPIIINSSELDKDVKDLVICIVESARDNKKMMQGIVGKVIIKRATELYKKHNLGKPRAKYVED